MLLGVFPIAMWLQGSVDKVTNPLNSDLQSKTALEVTLFPFCEIAEKKLMLLEGSGGGSWAWGWELGLWSHLRSFPLALICNNKYWQSESVIIWSFKTEPNALFWNFCEYNCYWDPIDSKGNYTVGFSKVWGSCSHQNLREAEVHHLSTGRGHLQIWSPASTGSISLPWGWGFGWSSLNAQF